MLVELGVVEQRYNAVKEVLEGATVTDVARRNRVVRQTVHVWLRRYANGGMGALVAGSSRPARCPHQMPAEVEAAALEMRRRNPDWGPRRIVFELRRAGIRPLPGRTSVYRALIRHGVIEPGKRARRRSDYKRWERSRPMELWQIDVVGRIKLADGTELSAVTGIDDHSRFCVIARLVRRATAQPVCDALLHGLRTHGVPETILTDNGSVFTGRFTSKSSRVRFDRICHENGVKHILTAPYSPTTTGKIERLHKTMRREHFRDAVFATIEEAQEALDRWVEKYNTERPHQSIGDVPPIERFKFTGSRVQPADDVEEEVAVEVAGRTRRPAGTVRWVDQVGTITLAHFTYHVGKLFVGKPVEVVVSKGLVQIFHRDVLVATHAQKRPEIEVSMSTRDRMRRPRAATVGATVTRIVDSSGSISFAGQSYRAGRSQRGRAVEVTVVAGSVQIALEGHVIRLHPIRHSAAAEHGAFAIPQGRPGKRRRTASTPANAPRRRSTQRGS